VELREGAVIANRFRLVRQLGRGGMGEVWAAQHTSLDIPCAVKFIHAESANRPEVRARFEREAKASAQLRTPNVVQILDYGVWENTPYIAMEYLDGEPLNARLKRRGRLDPHETFRIIAGVGKGLSKAHQAGIVHRDLKPENIFLVPDDGQEVAKVLDFGVAKETTALDSNTATGALLGTPYYMSPEQAQGTKAIDHRADLWSLAVVTFRCLTGELPFKSQALGDLLIKIVTHPVPVPSHVFSGVPDGFDAWWAIAAERDPAKRFQSAKELVEALGLALNVSVPATLGAGTPMPGMPPVQALSSQTMATQPHEASGAGALPFGTPNPAMGSGAHAAVSGPYPAAPPRHPSYADPSTADGHGASVGGVATASPVAKGGGSKVAALVAIVAAILVVGGVGAFLFMREGAGAAASGESTQQTDVEPTDEPIEEPPSEPSAASSAEAAAEPSASASAEPESSAAPSETVEPETAEPSAPVQTRPRPVPVPRPKSQPKPTPKPQPDGYDPGF
jgi:serine/threonine-protein kinase